jgi:hypothetical protein
MQLYYNKQERERNELLNGYIFFVLKIKIHCATNAKIANGINRGRSMSRVNMMKTMRSMQGMRVR